MTLIKMSCHHTPFSPFFSRLITNCCFLMACHGKNTCPEFIINNNNIIIISGFVNKKFWHHSPTPYGHVCIRHLQMIHQCIIHIIYIDVPTH